VAWVRIVKYARAHGRLPDTRGIRHGTQKAVLQMRSRRPRRLTLAVLVVAVLGLGACGGGDEEPLGGSEGTQEAGGGKSLTVGGANFTEMQIMQEMYKALLEKEGYAVEVKSAGQREIYAKSLVSGEIDIVPEYAATMAEYLNKQANGPSAAAIATPDAAATVAAMKPLAEAQGLTVLEPAKAIDSNGFYVTKEFAQQNNLRTLSDLAALGLDLTIAAGDECLQPERIYCAPGLTQTYGLKIASVTGDDFGSTSGKQKVLAGQAQLGLTGTTDGTLDGLGLVILEDDKKLQAADNLVPIVNAKEAGDAEIAGVLNGLADVLTTEDLARLNLKVDGERQQPAAVAQEYLEEKSLL
jgi:osmoprotectant transport system substrate-binding protein